jgi:DNA-binding MarR family transcriptional regulator
MAGLDVLRKSHIDLLRLLSTKGDNGERVNEQSPQFKQSGRDQNDFKEWLDALYDQGLIETVPGTIDVRITAAGRQRLARRG